MTRHIIDRPETGKDSGRLRNFIAVERQTTPHPAAEKLHQRSHERDEARRMREYLRIERGHTA